MIFCSHCNRGLDEIEQDIERSFIMKIKEILSMNRRDFYANYECEFCGYIDKDERGYDDSNFHNNVIPNMVCTKCGKKSSVISSSAKNPDWMQY